MFRLIPESPRWLLYKGRVQEARAVVMKVVQFNKLSPPPGADCEGRLEANDEGRWGGEVEEGTGENAGEVEEGTGEKEEEPSEKFWILLKYPNLVTRTGIIIFNWYVKHQCKLYIT